MGAGWLRAHGAPEGGYPSRAKFEWGGLTLRAHLAYARVAGISPVLLVSSAVGEASSIAGPDMPASSESRTTDVEFDSYGRLLIKTQSAADPRLRLYGLDRSLLKEWISPKGSSGNGRVGTLRVSGDGLRALGSGLMTDLSL